MRRREKHAQKREERWGCISRGCQKKLDILLLFTWAIILFKYSRNQSNCFYLMLMAILSDNFSIINQYFSEEQLLDCWLHVSYVSRFRHYFIFFPLSDNWSRKILRWKQVYCEGLTVGRMQMRGNDAIDMLISIWCYSATFCKYLLLSIENSWQQWLKLSPVKSETDAVNDRAIFSSDA